MPLFRCLNCMNEFTAEKPSCADCELDPAKDKRHAEFFLPLLIHHFDPPTKVEGIGKGHAACDSRIKVGRIYKPKCMFTGETSAVNCPACKATDEFKKAEGSSPGMIAIPVKPLTGD